MRFSNFLIFALLITVSSVSADAYLTPQDQKYFKNDIMDGNNTIERISMNVREINKLHGQIEEMKAQMAVLKTQVEELQKKK